jgi:hypothetical protein
VLRWGEWADRNELGSDGCQVGDNPVEVGGVADIAGQPSNPVDAVLDSELVEQRTQETRCGTPFDDYLVGGRCVHAATIAASTRERLT